MLKYEYYIDFYWTINDLRKKRKIANDRTI